MNLLKKLPWLTIAVVAVVLLKFYPEIKKTMEKSAPGLSKFLFNGQAAPTAEAQIVP